MITFYHSYASLLPSAFQWMGPHEKPEFRSYVKSKDEKAHLYRAQDYLQETIHFAASLSLIAAVGFWAGPILLACCATAAGVFVVGGSLLSEKLSFSIFKRRRIKLREKTGLAQSVESLTHRAGLTHKPILYDYEVSRAEIAKRPDDSLTTPPQFKRVVNAAAVNLTKPRVIISEPLLQLMNPSETHSIVAHEFTHLGAHHSIVQMIAGWMQTTIMLTALFGVGSVVIGQGWLIAALSLAGTVGIALIGNKLMPKKEDRYTRDGSLKPKVRRMQMAIWALQEILSVGLLAIPNPYAVLTAVAIEHGFFWSANLVLKSLSRRQEFQADRGAVAMGANPLALITSLRKLEAVRLRDEPELAKSLNWRQGTWLTRLTKGI